MRQISEEETGLVAGGYSTDSDVVIGQGKDFWNDWADMQGFGLVSWSPSGSSGGTIGTTGSASTVSTQSEAIALVKEMKNLASASVSVVCTVDYNNQNGENNWKVSCTVSINAAAGGGKK